MNSPERSIFHIKMAELFRSSVQRVASDVQEVGMCVVSGRTGIGKSGLFYPELERALAGYSLRSRMVDIREAAILGEIRIDSLLESIRPEDTKSEILVIDEAQHLAQLGPDSISRIITYIHQNYQAFIPLIAYKVARLEERDLWENNLQRVGREVFVREVPVHRLPNPGQEHIAAYIESYWHERVPQDVVKLILDVFPGDIKELSIMGDSVYSLAVIRDYLINTAPFWFWDGQVSNDEWGRLKTLSPQLSRAEEVFDI